MHPCGGGGQGCPDIDSHSVFLLLWMEAQRAFCAPEDFDSIWPTLSHHLFPGREIHEPRTLGHDCPLGQLSAFQSERTAAAWGQGWTRQCRPLSLGDGGSNMPARIGEIDTRLDGVWGCDVTRAGAPPVHL